METWKKIKNIPEYEVSTLGNVRKICDKTQCKQYGTTYLQVIINNSHYYVHRLVAQTFLENLENLPEINHKDENPRNNNVENLEWCSSKYNSNYGNHCKNISTALKGKKKLREDGSNWLSERNKGNYRGCKSKQEYLEKHPNPKGAFEGHKHSEETKKKISETCKKNWKNQFTKEVIDL